MLKPDRILKAYGMMNSKNHEMIEEIECELQKLSSLLEFPSQITEQLPLPLYNNLLRPDEPRIIHEWEKENG